MVSDAGLSLALGRSAASSRSFAMRSVDGAWHADTNLASPDGYVVNVDGAYYIDDAAASGLRVRKTGNRISVYE